MYIYFTVDKMKSYLLRQTSSIRLYRRLYRNYILYFNVCIEEMATSLTQFTVFHLQLVFP